MAQIVLGERAIVSQDATLCAGTHDVTDRHFQLQVRPIALGADAWVAAEAFVGPGVTLGEGAVLGARAVAFKDLDPWTIYVGNPCTALKPRTLRN
jgi:putative colanic acid biosynthesis acetyltransferase WcaF